MLEAQLVTKEPAEVKCFKCDWGSDLPDCQYVKYSPPLCCGVCTHPCVQLLLIKLQQAKAEVNAQERRVKAFREAVEPFIRNCKDVIAAAERQGM